MKRRGFTLIELMVVIAIIIILAAIAIPNYLTMTARAKKSRVASDFAAIATALETYRSDWNTYPVFTANAIITVTNGVAAIPTGGVGAELTGTGTVNNDAGGAHTTAAGDKSPILYMTVNVLKSMINPYDSAKPYKYSCPTGGASWTLSAAGDTTNLFWVRQDTTTNLSSVTIDPNA